MGHRHFTLSDTASVLGLPGFDLCNIADPFGQFEWLRRQLARAAANGSAVYIIGHIPPVVESYNMGRFQWDSGWQTCQLSFQAAGV
jgi:hypothetical protein